MHDFKKLKVWEKSIDLVINVYTLTEEFPRQEKYGLISQIQRAAVSITCNISEGCGKGTKKDFKRFLNIAVGSANEVENLLIISNRLDYMDDSDFKILNEKVVEINRMLKGLGKTLL